MRSAAIAVSSTGEYRCVEDAGTVLLVVGAILAGSILVALGAARVGVPSLVAFLALGMLLGSDGPGGIDFDDAELTRRVGIVGLGLILYEGGLQTSWRRLREVAVPAALLSTVGVLVSAFVTALAARALFDLSWLEAILLVSGTAIVSLLVFGSDLINSIPALICIPLAFLRGSSRFSRSIHGYPMRCWCLHWCFP